MTLLTANRTKVDTPSRTASHSWASNLWYDLVQKLSCVYSYLNLHVVPSAC